MGQPIGLAKLQDTSQGLAIEGQLVLDVAKAKEVYSLLKARVLRALSIGYDAIKADFKDGVRQLREVKLHEISIVVAPMNEQALITGVKSVEENIGGEIRAFRALLAECRKSIG
jgi:hypothetical protein